MTYFQSLQQRNLPWVFSDKNIAELKALADGAIVADAQGALIFFNAAAIVMHGRMIMGVQPEDYSHIHGLFTEDGRPYPSSDLPLMRAAIGGETVLNAKWRIRRPDGSLVLANGDAMPIYQKSGQRKGAILVFSVTDI